MTTTKKVYITRNALFANIPMVLCNKITEVDESFVEDNMDIFYKECEKCDGKGKECEECYGEGDHNLEPYQFYIASLTDFDKEAFRAYGVPFGYSNLLDVDIIPIYDYGTSWEAFSYSKEVPEDYRLAHNETLNRTTHY